MTDAEAGKVTEQIILERFQHLEILTYPIYFDIVNQLANKYDVIYGELANVVSRVLDKHSIMIDE